MHNTRKEDISKKLSPQTGKDNLTKPAGQKPAGGAGQYTKPDNRNTPGHQTFKSVAAINPAQKSPLSTTERR